MLICPLKGGRAGGGGKSIVTLSVTGKLGPPALVALIVIGFPFVTLNVPAVVGVPEINPVVVFTVKPAGNGVALKLVGLFVAVI